MTASGVVWRLTTLLVVVVLPSTGCSDSSNAGGVDAAAVSVPEMRVLDGPRQGARFGASVSLGPDADGDGLGDLLVGAPYSSDPPSASEPGEAFLYSGTTGALLHMWRGSESGGEFGRCVVLGKDANGDGLGDVLVSEPFVNDGTGRACLYSGGSGEMLHCWDGEAPGGSFGLDCALGSDVDGDGRADVLVAARDLQYDCVDLDGERVCRTGRVYLYSGTTGSLAQRWDAPNRDFSRFGTGVAFAGELGAQWNVVVSEPGAGNDQGAMYAMSASDGSHVGAWQGSGAGAYFGTAIASGADADGDRVADLLVASDVYFGLGRVSLFSGATLSTTELEVWLEETDEWAFGAGISLGPDADSDECGDVLVGSEPRPGFVGRATLLSGKTGLPINVWEGETINDGFGGRVSLGPDINGDGRADVAVGAYNADAAGRMAGRVYLLVGAPE